MVGVVGQRGGGVAPAACIAPARKHALAHTNSQARAHASDYLTPHAWMYKIAGPAGGRRRPHAPTPHQSHALRHMTEPHHVPHVPRCSYSSAHIHACMSPCKQAQDPPCHLFSAGSSSCSACIPSAAHALLQDLLEAAEATMPNATDASGYEKINWIYDE